ncbi:O-antigen ligase family protein [Hwanghaeella grinnelliae]|nr:O-antigen ligase family protein [Hwanghaeella grinnelliae]
MVLTVLILAVLSIFCALPFLSLIASQQAPIALILLTIFLSLALFVQWRLDPGFTVCLVPDRKMLVWIGITGICLVYIAASCFWSSNPADSLQRLKRLGLLLAIGFLAVFAAQRVPPASHRLMLSVVFAVTGFAALFVSEKVFGLLSNTIWASESDEFKAQFLNRPSTYMVMLAWPAAYAAHRAGKNLVSWALVISLPLVLFWSSSTSGALSAAAGFGAFLVTSLNRKAATILFGAVVFVSVLAIPYAIKNEAFLNAAVSAVRQTGAFSAAHRLGIWNFVASRSDEKPLFGWGVDVGRTLPGAEILLGDVESFSPYLDKLDQTFPTLRSSPALPLHPHNAALQLHLELGVVGAVSFCLVVVYAAFSLAKIGSPSAARYTVAWATSWFVIAYFSIGLWQTWWWALSAICLIQFTYFCRSCGADRYAPTEQCKHR